MLYLGKLFQEAWKKVKDDGYKFKKGFPRSSQESCSSDDRKEEEKQLKRKNMLTEERRATIAATKLC